MFCRASGVLMHISSLAGDYGIGTLGKNAYDFVDFLAKNEQSYWQILPLCPTSMGGCNSPYQSESTFAGNPLFIDLELLKKDGFLNADDLKGNKQKNTKRVDYNSLYQTRQKVFLKVYESFIENTPEDFASFCKEHKFWLDDYALFMAIKYDSKNKPITSWQADIRYREKNAIKRLKTKFKSEILFYKMLQYFFFKQWYQLKEYANKKGIGIIGDIPIYVSLDSADVWSNPKNFMLNSKLVPTVVAGCPPDKFSVNGQLWGNPVYDWENLKKDGYGWWIARIGHSLKMYDAIRIDHFRGFDSFYCVPYNSKTARIGSWVEGPRMDFINKIKENFKDAKIIAEDLGFLTNSVRDLLKSSGYYGMKILQFAFSGNDGKDYLPHNYTKNCVVYTGTHDNDTICGYLKFAKAEEINYARRYLRTENLKEGIIAAALASTSNLSIIPMQDILGLDYTARMNIPATVSGNWEWRCSEKELTEVNDFLLKNTRLYGRGKEKANETT